MQRTSFVEILSNTTSLTPEQIARAEQTCSERNLRLEEALLQQRAITEEELLQAQAQHLSLPYWKELPEDEFDTSLMTQIPLAFARQHKLIPIRLRDGHVDFHLAAFRGDLDFRALHGLRFRKLNHVLRKHPSRHDVVREYRNELRLVFGLK